MLLKDKKVIVFSDNIDDLFKTKKEKQIALKNLFDSDSNLANKNEKDLESEYLKRYHKQLSNYFNLELPNNLIRYFVHDMDKANFSYTYELDNPNLSRVLDKISDDIVSNVVYYDRTTVKSIQLDSKGKEVHIEYKIVHPNLTVEEFEQKAEEFRNKNNMNLNKRFIYDRSKSIFTLVKEKHESFMFKI